MKQNWFDDKSIFLLTMFELPTRASKELVNPEEKQV